MSILEKRIEKAVEEAELAFWSSVSDSFPEIKTGDFPILETMQLTLALEEAVKLWHETNKANAYVFIGSTGELGTGRVYDFKQVITWEIADVSPLELDTCLITLTFEDRSRNISGNCRLFLPRTASSQAIGQEVLNAYDTGCYTDS